MDTDDSRAGGEDGARRPDLRVGDAERRDALEALGRHLEAGRLDIDEYGERSAHAAAAVRCSDLEPLFADLPAPHPRLPRPPLPEPPPGLPVHPAGEARPAPVPSPHDRRGHPAPPPALRAGVLALALVLPVLLVLSASTGMVGGLLVLPLLLVILGGTHGGPGHRHGPGNRW